MDSLNQEHEEENDRIREIVDRLAGQIREHVDSVQIFVTRHRDDGSNTMSYETGMGNFYARQGQVIEWITMQSQFQKNEAIRRDQQD